MTLESRLRAQLADWRGLLQRNVAEARAVLRTLLIGPLRFTPVDDGRRHGYAFEGTIALDRLLAGVVELPSKVASLSTLSWNQIFAFLESMKRLRDSAGFAA